MLKASGILNLFSIEFAHTSLCYFPTLHALGDWRRLSLKEANKVAYSDEQDVKKTPDPIHELHKVFLGVFLFY